ncbi:MAG TPA: MerR family transcriptional regulator [Candidatus Acidoferrum sp.]|nr:MerR family transcriptional regulator [Candidatus Acidoferrum sp.]
MEGGSKEVYKALEFAKLAGVTVRALHHYDRLGLLKPKQRTRSGYRLYTNRDFGRLEQIVVLKFLGMPLKQIRGLLEAESKMPMVLQRQQEVLSEKRRQLDKAIRAIGNAQYALQSRGEPDWKLFQLVVQEIEMQNSQEWKAQYFSAEARAKVAERQKLWSPELQARVEKEWEQLYADVEACLDEDPAGPKGQALAARSFELINQFTGGDPEILKGVKAMWEDRSNWKREHMSEKFNKPKVQEFLRKASEAKKQA